MPEGLVAVVRAQREGCAIGGSPLYTHLLDRVADDVATGGPCATALATVADEPPAHAGVLRFLAAVHELALDGRAPALAAHYPSCGGRPGPGLGDAFVGAVAAHPRRVAAVTARPIQTNEVGRAAPLLGGLLELARAARRPLRLLELGASAGLNLHLDRFRLEVDGLARGPAGSPVRLRDPWTGPGPALDTPLEVVERRGCDARPLDAASPADRLWLRACLWPDQVERRARLDGALALAAEAPVAVERADAATWVATALARPTPGVATVVLHSIVAQYLPPETRRATVAAIAAAGARATRSAPLAWLRLEPADAREAELRLTTWGGRDRHRVDPAGRVLARAGFHGLPVHWSPPPA